MTVNGTCKIKCKEIWLVIKKYKQSAEKKRFSTSHIFSLPTYTYFFRFLCAAPHPGYQGHFLVKNTSEKSGTMHLFYILI